MVRILAAVCAVLVISNVYAVHDDEEILSVNATIRAGVREPAARTVELYFAAEGTYSGCNLCVLISWVIS